MTIYDKTEMVGRTNIEQMNKLFNMGSELESLVDGNSGDITAIESDIDDIQGDIADIEDELDDKQDALVSGTNIKTINGDSILGSGNLEISGSDITVDDELDNTSENPVQNAVITSALNSKQNTLVSGTNIKTINGSSIIGSGNLEVVSTVDSELSSESTNPVQNAVITDALSDKVDSSSLATVATTGAYSDISGTPDLSIYAESSNLSTVATTGAYSDLSGTPSLSTVATSGSYNDLTNKPDLTIYAESSDLATVASTGSYSDLSDKPIIDDELSSSSMNAVQNAVITDALDDKQDTLVSGTSIKTINSNSILGSGDISIAEATIYQPNEPTSGATGQFWYKTDTSDLYICTSTNPVTWTLVVSGSSTTVAWGNITGTVSNQSDLISLLSTYVLQSSLATVATSGSYNDLTNTPTIPPAVTVDATLDSVSTNPVQNSVITNALDDKVDSSSLSTVATTGSYNDLSNKPDLSVYAETSDLATVATTGAYSDLSGKPDLSVYAETSDLATVATTGAYSDLTGTPSLATVATTGSYNDLSNKPNIPDAQVQSDWNQTNSNAVDYIKNKPVIPSAVTVDSALDSTSENPVQNKVINTALGTKADTSSLATVATSGSYNDLSDQPTIPEGLPDTTGASANDVLSLDSNLDAVWSTPQIGGVTRTRINSYTELKNFVLNGNIGDKIVGQTLGSDSSNSIFNFVITIVQKRSSDCMLSFHCGYTKSGQDVAYLPLYGFYSMSNDYFEFIFSSSINSVTQNSLQIKSNSCYLTSVIGINFN